MVGACLREEDGSACGAELSGRSELQLESVDHQDTHLNFPDTRRACCLHCCKERVEGEEGRKEGKGQCSAPTSLVTRDRLAIAKPINDA